MPEVDGPVPSVRAEPLYLRGRSTLWHGPLLINLERSNEHAL